MITVKNTTLLVCLPLLALLTSCSTWDGNVGVAQMVDPQIIKVEADGKQAWVNVGAFDRIRPGQRLYVVRDNKVVGVLAVRDLRDYSAQCMIVGSASQGNMGRAFGTEPGDPAVGDRVAREFRDITRIGQIRDRVPRFITVRADTPEASFGEVEAEIDPFLSPEGKAKKEALKKIPREEYEEWKRRHLPPPPPGG